MRRIHTLGLWLVAAIAAAGLAGCSTDENPVSPQKMEEIRKKEADERANFQPPTTGTKPSGS